MIYLCAGKQLVTAKLMVNVHCHNWIDRNTTYWHWKHFIQFLLCTVIVNKTFSMSFLGYYCYHIAAVMYKYVAVSTLLPLKVKTQYLHWPPMTKGSMGQYSRSINNFHLSWAGSVDTAFLLWGQIMCFP